MISGTMRRLAATALALASLLFTQSQAASPQAASGAATLGSQIDTAMVEMKREFGDSVFVSGREDLQSAGHGQETIGEAWARELISAGVPAKSADREALAHMIGLDPQASLALAGPMARLDAITYLRSQLRRIAQEP